MEYKMTSTLEILDIFLPKLGREKPISSLHLSSSSVQVLPQAKSMCAKTSPDLRRESLQIYEDLSKVQDSKKGTKELQYLNRH